ncbi:MAG: class I SAM-dependent methyltransferase [Bryobacteraceae bacterium]
MLSDRLKSFFGGGTRSPTGPPPQPAPPGGARFPARAQPSHKESSLRTSRGLEEFFHHIREQSGLTILDLGGASQENVSFITNLGHRLYSEDFLHILEEAFGLDNNVDQSNPGRIEYFLQQALDYPEGHFDGVLIWDSLEYLTPPLLVAVTDRLRKIVRPEGYMLAFFHSDDKQQAVPLYTFRIQSVNTLELVRQGMHRPPQLFNNRNLEKLFGRFDSVKFFLTREQLREVIVKT